MNYKHLAKTQV